MNLEVRVGHALAGAVAAVAPGAAFLAPDGRAAASPAALVVVVRPVVAVVVGDVVAVVAFFQRIYDAASTSIEHAVEQRRVTVLGIAVMSRL